MGSLAGMEQIKKRIGVSASEESTLRKQILQVHAHDGNDFKTESLLATIQGILNHVNQPDEPINHGAADLVLDIIQPSLLHEISCLLKCKCSVGDGHTTALEILQLLSTYNWEVKILIISASLVVEYAQYHLIKTNSNSISLAKVVATLKHCVTGDDGDDDDNIKTKLDTVVRLVEFSMEMSSLISKFGCLPLHHISIDVHHLALAINQFPTAVYWITRLLVACTSDFTAVYGCRQIQTSYTEETLNITSLEEKITTIKTRLNAQLDLCNVYVEDKKHIKFVQKLKGMFSKQQSDNQKILQTILVKKKDASLPLSCGPEVTVETLTGVEALKGKTVLLLISSLEISEVEITKLSEFYKESRTNSKLQYEIVWLPIVEKSVSVETIEKKFVELKKNMPWHTLVKPGMLKPGLARYAKEEWKYSKKTIMVALDQQGKVANQNAFHTLWTWGNEVYPFSLNHEIKLWRSKEWSLELLVDDKLISNISTWIKDDKVICLYGGENYEWIQELVTTARKIESEAKINLEMVYIGKEMSAERITRTNGIVGNRSVCLEATASTQFWKRIECMMYSKVQRGAKFKTKKDDVDQILGELLKMLTLGESDKGWCLMSQGRGSGLGKITLCKGDVIVTALTEFEKWSGEVVKKSFVVALHEYICGQPVTEHHCNRLILPGMDDIPEILECTECRRPMEKFIMYRCCTD